MKNDSTPSNKPSTNPAGSAQDHQNGRAGSQPSQEQQEMSNDTSAIKPSDTKHLGGTTRGTAPEQQAETSDRMKDQPSPSRDQGHSPSASPGADTSNKR